MAEELSNTKKKRMKARDLHNRLNLRDLLAEVARLMPGYVAIGASLYFGEDHENHPFRHPLLDTSLGILTGGHAAFMLRELSLRTKYVRIEAHKLCEWRMEVQVDKERPMHMYGKTPEEVICRAWVAIRQLPGFADAPCKSGN